MAKIFTSDEAKQVGDKLGVEFKVINLEQFRLGLNVELEHGRSDPQTNITDSGMTMTGKIAWAHLKEIPDYYTRLAKMETDADAEKSKAGKK